MYYVTSIFYILIEAGKDSTQIHFGPLSYPNVYYESVLYSAMNCCHYLLHVESCVLKEVVLLCSELVVQVVSGVRCTSLKVCLHRSVCGLRRPFSPVLLLSMLLC